jgi:hypothetical protein
MGSALRCVVLVITNTITNIFWRRHRAIGIMEVALGAEIAIFSTIGR